MRCSGSSAGGQSAVEDAAARAAQQGRAFGLGCLLATQNPVDLDYKGLSNCGTWWLGRLQTERDKARVLDGLEGAIGEGGGRFDRSYFDQALSGLSSRVFVMNNVHEDAPSRSSRAGRCRTFGDRSPAIKSSCSWGRGSWRGARPACDRSRGGPASCPAVVSDAGPGGRRTCGTGRCCPLRFSSSSCDGRSSAIRAILCYAADGGRNRQRGLLRPEGGDRFDADRHRARRHRPAARQRRVGRRSSVGDVPEGARIRASGGRSLPRSPAGCGESEVVRRVGEVLQELAGSEPDAAAVQEPRYRRGIAPRRVGAGLPRAPPDGGAGTPR